MRFGVNFMFILLIIIFLLIKVFFTYSQATSSQKPSQKTYQKPVIRTSTPREELEKIYDYIGDYYNNRAKVRKNNKWGYIDENGYLIIPVEYISCNHFSEDLAVVFKECRNSHSLWHCAIVIDKVGSWISKPIPIRYTKLDIEVESYNYLIYEENLKFTKKSNGNKTLQYYTPSHFYSEGPNFFVITYLNNGVLIKTTNHHDPEIINNPTFPKRTETF